MDFSYLCALWSGKKIEGPPRPHMRNQVCLISILLIFIPLCAAKAQNQTFVVDETQHAGTEVEVDSTLLGKNIFSLLSNDVTIVQPTAVRDVIDAQARENEGTTFNGFRIRLYIGSSPDARETSLATLKKFNSMYPHIQVFRSYTAPNFKVSVGNFRTRVDAELVLREIKDEFPEAFIVRERFKYPSIGVPDFSGEESEESLFPGL